MYMNSNVPPVVAKRRALERKVAKRLLTALLAAGYAVSVYNGGDGPECVKATTYGELWVNCGNADLDELVVWRKNANTIRWERAGWVQLVYGNDGYDLIADYTTNLSDIIDPISEWAMDLA